ncbi:MAG: TIGR00730 family Rossman fold protein [Ignavibacteriae bacterium HGW-Ignavibacteriae-2]|jgi:hypothetical protein|nr:MAG: TIGR00730 family Rossman fold protein [Ignavibacteriae bacterium HGW-Ignavibacteriae-2]
MPKAKKPIEKAYKNLEFLNSADARTLRILAEFYEPQARFKKNNIVDTIVFFGSARITSKKECQKNLRELKKSDSKKVRGLKGKIELAEKMLSMSHYYEDAVELSRKLTEWSLSVSKNHKRFTICSGGGPGIMEAASKGAKLGKGPAVGLNISLPFEQFVNEFIDPELAFEFHYFFMRKFWLVYLAKALVVFPGGFGTLDELMEVITLSQTGKIKKDMKIIIYDEKYWNEIINFEALVQHGMISRSDLKLFDFCNTVDEAFERIKSHFIKHYL